MGLFMSLKGRLSSSQPICRWLGHEQRSVLSYQTTGVSASAFERKIVAHAKVVTMSSLCAGQQHVSSCLFTKITNCCCSRKLGDHFEQLCNPAGQPQCPINAAEEELTLLST